MVQQGLPVIRKRQAVTLYHPLGTTETGDPGYIGVNEKGVGGRVSVHGNGEFSFVKNISLIPQLIQSSQSFRNILERKATDKTK